MAEGCADYIPVFLSDIPDLFKRKIRDIDVAIVQVSQPDAHGYCSLSLSIDIARSAVDNAKQVIGLVNPLLPRTHGDGMIHTDHFSKMVFHPSDLVEEVYSEKVGETEMIIGKKNFDSLIEDGSTLQRAKALINIAHPGDREALTKYCYNRFGIFLPG